MTLGDSLIFGLLAKLDMNMLIRFYGFSSDIIWSSRVGGESFDEDAQLTGSSSMTWGCAGGASRTNLGWLLLWKLMTLVL